MNAMMVTGGKPQAGGKVGRPQSADNNLSDSAEQTRTDGGNIEKGGDE